MYSSFPSLMETQPPQTLHTQQISTGCVCPWQIIHLMSLYLYISTDDIVHDNTYQTTYSTCRDVGGGGGGLGLPEALIQQHEMRSVSTAVPATPRSSIFPWSHDLLWRTQGRKFGLIPSSPTTDSSSGDHRGLTDQSTSPDTWACEQFAGFGATVCASAGEHAMQLFNHTDTKIGKNVLIRLNVTAYVQLAPNCATVFFTVLLHGVTVNWVCTDVKK